MEGCGDMERRVPYAMQLLYHPFCAMVPSLCPFIMGTAMGEEGPGSYQLLWQEKVTRERPGCGQFCGARLWVQLRGALYGNGAEHSTGRTESFRGE